MKNLSLNLNIDLQNKSKLVAISSTVPIEIIYASHFIPIDLNNIFITSNSNEILSFANNNFLLRTVCSWTCGVLATAALINIKNIIIVTEGDCAHTIPISGILKSKNFNVFNFKYPNDHNFLKLKSEIKKMMDYFNVSYEKCEIVKEKLDETRKLLKQIDELTYKELKVSGFENHLYLVSASDFNSNIQNFHNKVKVFLDEAKNRNKKDISLRIGHVGIPPIFNDYYQFISSLGSEVVFNETQRQFSLIENIGLDIYKSYFNYTYPYNFKLRVNDIKKAIYERELDCIIHYVQSFCFHQIEDKLLRSELPNFPILTLEGNLPQPLNENDKLKIENFILNVEKKKYKLKTTNKSIKNTIAVGIDFGSRFVKIGIFYIKNNTYFSKFLIYDTMDFILEYFSNHNANFLKFENLIVNKLKDEEKINTGNLNFQYFSTGYGRYKVTPFNAKAFSEIECHAKGVIYETKLTNFTLLDVGGQDIKVALIKNKNIEKFMMNDKCAAGSGRYIENMANILKIDLNEISKYYLEPEPLSITCATFGETEVIAKLIAGIDIKKIIAGINYTVYAKVEPLLNEHRSKSNVLVVTSGISKNFAFMQLLKNNANFSKIIVPNNAQFMGALGAIVNGLNMI